MTNEDILFFKGKEGKTIGESDLSEEIYDCLKSENINILLGAGCSSFINEDNNEIGIPTMNQLTQEFYEAHPQLRLETNELASERYPQNLEDLMNYLISAESVFNEDRKQSIVEQMNLIKSFIFNRIKEADYSNEIIRIYKDFYVKIAKLGKRKAINIYTTNYDLYNECALDELGFNYNNGFMGSLKRYFNPNSYNYTLVENMNLRKDAWEQVPNFFSLFKIHGSINWMRETDKETNLPKIVEKDLQLIGKTEDFQCLMIYPSPQKDRSTLMVPYSDLFRMMQNNLMRNNSVLITIGYSFSDEHINRVIFNALSVSNFKLVIFGDSERIKKIAQADDERILIINSKSRIHYFNSIVEKVLKEPDIDIENEMALRRKIALLEPILDIRKGIDE